MNSYVRAMAEEAYYDAKIERWNSAVGDLMPSLTRVTALAQSATSSGVIPIVSWQKMQREDLGLHISKLELLMKPADSGTHAAGNVPSFSATRPAVSDTTWKLIQSLARESDLSMASRRAAELTKMLTEEKEKLTAAKISAAQMQTSSLEAAEKWGMREKSACDYHREMDKQDAAWLQKESEANAQALRTMRSLLPTNITELTVVGLVEQAAGEGVILPFELAAYLKSTSLLHWCVLHPSDISAQNFLSGSAKAQFEAFNALDVCETR